MFQLAPQMRILVAVEPVDGRKGIDSLAQLCREKLAEDPFSGSIFVFRNRSGTSVRLLAYDLCAAPVYEDTGRQRLYRRGLQPIRLNIRPARL